MGLPPGAEVSCEPLEEAKNAQVGMLLRTASYAVLRMVVPGGGVEPPGAKHRRARRRWIYYFGDYGWAKYEATDSTLPDMSALRGPNPY
jgi:hypothetical protein